MNLEELLSKNKIRGIKPSKEKASKNLKIAERDLKATKDLYKHENYDWVLITSYNAMLQAARAYMFYKGYAPRGPHKHLSTVQFLRTFENTFEELTIDLLDRVRKRRHATVYDQPATVSKTEAKKSIDRAEKFVEKVKNEIN